jgi:CBS domain-containing protein
MKSVKQIIDAKGDDICFIQPDETVFNAIKMMAEKEIGAILVMEDDKLVGILSERDYARKVILKGKSSEQTPVKEIMTTNVLCARLEQTVEECMALMTEKRIRHLPVIEEGRVKGMISIGDLVKDIIAEQKFMIEQLGHYISG